MGVFNGNLSYARYFVEGDLPEEEFRETLLKRIQQYAIPELTLDNEDEEVSGWACIEDLLDVDFEIEKVFQLEYILLSFRIDRWKVPPTLLKAHLLKAERQFLLENDREKITKRERDLLKEQVKLSLKKQLLPSLSVYDLCWHPDQKVLRFWSHSARVNEYMVELFEKTFGLSLVPFSAYTWAETLGLSEDDLLKMADLESEPYAELPEDE
ncbi:MAG TPA: hypothetical protein DCE42_10820 [Myxococcales bacterium]|nr:hypothetical protein [Deltaproteobacteria bacterium]HAA55239.1 hypothetical protein [Myxococcales bacterium]|tara:strand:- start:32926 stop:33558 length:633 start_codon:yes stop_codon:yes gene_type:complete